MSAWGSRSSSCESLLQRVERDDPSLLELCILPNKAFGAAEIGRLATALKGEPCNRHLEVINASGHAIPSSSIYELSCALSQGNSRVKRLAIGDSTMGDDGADAFCRGFALGGLSVLEEIDFSWKGITARGMTCIIATLGRQNTSLRRLILYRNGPLFERNTPFQPIDPPYFQHLSHLDLRDCKLDAFGCHILVSHLRPLGSERRLELRMSNNPICPSGFKCLCSLLQMSSIESLEVKNCGIGDEGIGHLRDVVVSNPELGIHAIDLSENGITVQGIECLTFALEHCENGLSSLRSLNLSDNDIGESGILSLSRSISARRQSKTSQLECLDLTRTNCGVEGPRELIRCAFLKELYLFDNHLRDEGIHGLQETLRGGHTTLEVLDVGGNRASSGAVVAFLRSLVSNAASDSMQPSKLKLLVIGGNGGGSEVEQAAKNAESMFTGLQIARDQQFSSQ